MGNKTIAERYGGVDALPTTFIIDQKGRIAAVHVGLASKSSYEKDLNQLLESSPDAHGARGAWPAQPCRSRKVNHLTVETPAKLVARRGRGGGGQAGGARRERLSRQQQRAGGRNYLIPLRLQWEPGALAAVEVVFPKPEMQKYEFSEKPLSVFSGDSTS